jgi:hypothetical protein
MWVTIIIVFPVVRLPRLITSWKCSALSREDRALRRQDARHREGV